MKAIGDDQWTEKKQKTQTKVVTLVRSTDLGTIGSMGSKDCKIVVRTTMETNPLKSACRPTLKLQIVPEMKEVTPSKHKGQTGEKMNY